MHAVRSMLRCCLSVAVGSVLLSSGAGCLSRTGTVPVSCEEGQILISVSGEWVCGAPPRYTPPPVPCGVGGGEVLTSNGSTLSCRNADYLLNYDIERTTRELAQLESRANTLRPGYDASPYRGVTTETFSGAITSPGVENGLAAAAARCSAQYGGSHLCSVFDLYDNVTQGRLTRDSRVPKAWIFFPGGNAAPAAEMPNDGIADTCAGYTYGQDDRGWTGVAAEWTLLGTGYAGFKFHGGGGAPCSGRLPLACCGGMP